MSDNSLRRMLPGATGTTGDLAAAGSVWRGGLVETFEREMEAGRGFPWLPVCFGIGVLIYFVLPAEPSLTALALLVIAALTLAAVVRRRGGLLRVALVLVCLAAGALTTKVHTDWAYAPKVPREMTAVVTGWVEEQTTARRGGIRVTLRVFSVERLAPDETPRKIRVTIRTDTESISIGDALEVTARIRPPNGPVIPGGYDFARAAYFQQIGAVGFAYGAARPADIGPAPLGIRIAKPLAELRDLIGKRIMAALPGDRGRVAVALITGERGGISEATQEAMRASGLGHILAISGLHMALIAGTAFWVIRALLALAPSLALRRPIKKWAATGALGVATFYLGISGAHIATQRAYIMLAIMLLAVLLDRKAITLRNVAIAAFVILLIAPESLLTASFQMSFAATIALVAAYEEITTWSSRRPQLADRGAASLPRKVGRFFSGLLITSLVAGLATTPFAIYHFQRMAPLTLLANLLAMPALALVVMPMAFLAVLVMPLGIEVVPLTVMNWGLAWIIAVAEWTSGLTGDAGAIQMLPALALLLVVSGFLWLALWRQPWRLLGILPIVIAIPVAGLATRPDILVNADGTTAALRGEDGRLSAIAGRGSRFAIENWLRADADPRDAGADELAAATTCDPLGCIGRTSDGITLALVRRSEAFAEDCQMVAIVVSRLEAPSNCRDHAIVIDRDRLRKYGAHAFYRLEDNVGSAPRFRITTAYPEIQRPWMPSFGRAE